FALYRDAPAPNTYGLMATGIRLAGRTNGMTATGRAHRMLERSGLLLDTSEDCSLSDTGKAITDALNTIITGITTMTVTSGKIITTTESTRATARTTIVRLQRSGRL